MWISGARVGAAGLEHRDADVRVLAQPGREHAARRSGADDHVVVDGISRLAADDNLHHLRWVLHREDERLGRPLERELVADQRRERVARCARRARPPRANSPPPQQLTPSRSSSFSVKLPIRSGTSAPDMPTCTTRPADAAMSTAARTAVRHAGGVDDDRRALAARPLARGAHHVVARRPDQRLGAQRAAELQPRSPAGRPSAPTRRGRARRRATHCPIGPAPSTTTRSPSAIAAAVDRAHRDRHRLGQRGDRSAAALVGKTCVARHA